jgi:hypothetical protein
MVRYISLYNLYTHPLLVTIVIDCLHSNISYSHAVDHNGHPNTFNMRHFLEAKETDEYLKYQLPLPS